MTVTSGYSGVGKFTPRRPVRSFRDLEVYRRSVECSVLVVKDLRPDLKKLEYPFLEGMVDCCMVVPLYMGESHSLRFSDFPGALLILEKAMASCNKMVIYLEQAVGLYGGKINQDLAEDLMHRYLDTRGKMFRLGKAWKKFRENNPQGPAPQGAVKY